MPTYIRPKFATVEPDGGGEWIGLLLALFVGAMVVGSLIAFVAAHAVLIACCVAAAGVVMATVVVWCRWISSPKRLAALRKAERAELPAPAAVALPRGWSASRALPAPVVHHHVHLHGVSADEAAEFINRREIKP